MLYTHEHADHTHGVDDLRALYIKQRRPIDVYLDDYTSKSMHTRFGYCFRAPPGSEYPPIVSEHRLTAGEPVTVAGKGGPLTALPILQQHGDIASFGFRFGNLAYSCDLSGMPPESAAALTGDEAVLDRIGAGHQDDRHRRRCRLGRGRRTAVHHQHGDRDAKQLRHQRRQAIFLIFRIAIFDGDVLPRDEACFLQTIAERDDKALKWGERRAAHEPDNRQRRLLRARAERPSDSRAANERDEVAPFHIAPLAPRWNCKSSASAQYPKSDTTSSTQRGSKVFGRNRQVRATKIAEAMELRVWPA